METIDRALATLASRKDAWARLPIGTKVKYLAALRTTISTEARAWVEAALTAKSIAPGSPLAGEEWLSGPYALLYALNRYVTSLEQIARDGHPRLDRNRLHVRSGGQVVARVFPQTAYDAFLYSGISADVWMQPGVTADGVYESMGSFYKLPDPAGHLCAVLGAGNIASIPALDVLYKLVADGSVCLLKMNPINAYLGPIFERIFAELIAGGFLQIVYGGADVGSYICTHDLVDEIHITGSDRTHDAIVFGTGPDAAERKRNRTPLLNKPITSELGNVSPTIVAGGPWSAADFRFHAENIATQKMHNGGFNCIAAQVLILPRDWDGTAKLLEALADLFRKTPPRVSYYPGAAQRRDAIAGAHTDAVAFDVPSSTVVPRTLVPVEAERFDDPAFSVEAFGPVLAYVTLPGDPATYLRTAVEFANGRLWGTLGANLVVHPKTERAMANEVDRAIANLRYGCIAVNAWTGVGYFIGETPWGAYPGHTLENVQSGIGVVHNTLLLGRTEKSVIRAPFAPFPRSIAVGSPSLLPKPPWFVTNHAADTIGRLLCAFEAHPSPLRAVAVAAAAMRG